jgi:hypothetical protein
MSRKVEFELPESVNYNVSSNPRDLVIVSQPKMGKGSILGSFSTKYNALVLDLEKGGYEYIPARKLSIYTEESTDDVDAFFNYIKIRNLLLENKGKYDFLIIDGLSDLDRMSELGGTLAYMDTIIGKKFNRDKGLNKLDIRDPEFKSVLTLADGAGYRHTREWFLKQIEIFRQISPYRLYAAHVADKYIKEAGKDEVVGSEIFLTGKLKNIFSAKVTALAKLIAEDKKRLLNFEVLNEGIIAGSRAPRLKGKILISEQNANSEEIETFWDNIYTKELLTKIKI